MTQVLHHIGLGWLRELVKCFPRFPEWVVTHHKHPRIRGDTTVICGFRGWALEQPIFVWQTKYYEHVHQPVTQSCQFTTILVVISPPGYVSDCIQQNPLAQPIPRNQQWAWTHAHRRVKISIPQVASQVNREDARVTRLRQDMSGQLCAFGLNFRLYKCREIACDSPYRIHMKFGHTDCRHHEDWFVCCSIHRPTKGQPMGGNVA